MMAGEELRFTGDDVERFSEALYRAEGIGEITCREMGLAVDGVKMFTRFLNGDPSFYFTAYSPQAYGESVIIAQEGSR